MSKKVIITEIDQLSPKEKEKLSKIGILIIEAKDPDKVRFLEEHVQLPSGDLIISLLDGVVSGGLSSSERFVKELRNRLKEKETINKPQQ